MSNEFEHNSPKEQKSIARITKVNHAGEYGAIRIYRAQLWMARRFYPELVSFLEETLGHEIKHCAMFATAMKERGTRPCRVMSLWGNGGYVLGFATALFGKQAIWICTSAVEGTVHKHLTHQISYLGSRDRKLCDLIKSIQQEELHHLTHADAHIESENFVSTTLRRLVSVTTATLIYLSTWGDSLKMARHWPKAK